MVPRWSTWACLHGRDAAQVVGICDGDGLVLVLVVAHSGLSENVKGSSKEDVVGWLINNVDLKLQFEAPKVKGQVLDNSKRLVHCSIGGLH